MRHLLPLLLALLLAPAALAGDLLRPAAYVDGDERRSPEAFAKAAGVAPAAVRARLPAVGFISCRRARLQVAVASVVACGRAVLTAGHALVEVGSNTAFEPTECRLLLRDGKGQWSENRLADRKPVTPFRADRRRLWHDWAVLALDSAPAGVTPLPLDTRGVKGLGPGAPLTLAVPAADDWKPPGEPYLSACAVKAIGSRGELIATDCDAERGASGSPVFAGGDGQGALIGHIIAGAELAGPDGRLQRAPYDLKTNTTLALALAPDARKAIAGICKP